VNAYFHVEGVQECLTSILALKADLEIFDEVMKALLDAESSETIVPLVFNLDDDFPIQKRTKINIDYE
jgi:hypothetical protein